MMTKVRYSIQSTLLYMNQLHAGAACLFTDIVLNPRPLADAIVILDV